MKYKGWRLAQCFQWVKERRPQVNLSSAVQQQLLEYEQKIFGSNSTAPLQFAPSNSLPLFGFGFPKPSLNVAVPTFNQQSAPSIFERVAPNNFPSDFTFGAGGTTEQLVVDSNIFNVLPRPGNEALMDSS